MPTRLLAYVVFCMAISVQVYADSSSTNKPDETNAPPVMGQLGYPVGTVLEVEAIVTGCAWNRPPPNLLSIYKVNGQDFKPPLNDVGFRLSKDFSRIKFRIGDICVFKGTESVFKVTTNEYEGRISEAKHHAIQLSPLRPGKYSTFTVTDIISAKHPPAGQQGTNAITPRRTIVTNAPTFQRWRSTYETILTHPIPLMPTLNIKIYRNLMGANDQWAERTRALLKKHHVVMFNLVAATR